ncbi:MAG: hypothetical protein WBW33_03055 [Bryobacteraceae bacterium]
MNWNKWVRQTHRWLSIAFTVAIIVNIIAVLQGKYSSKLGLLAVFPLALLIVTGLYLFVLPYAAKWPRGRRWPGDVESGRGRESALKNDHGLMHG